LSHGEGILGTIKVRDVWNSSLLRKNGRRANERERGAFEVQRERTGNLRRKWRRVSSGAQTGAGSRIVEGRGAPYRGRRGVGAKGRAPRRRIGGRVYGRGGRKGGCKEGVVRRRRRGGSGGAGYEEGGDGMKDGMERSRGGYAEGGYEKE
ncbi:conserved hypothetical protein, partial [Ixodes scapularis]